jgi:hypothetical protein
MENGDGSEKSILSWTQISIDYLSTTPERKITVNPSPLHKYALKSKKERDNWLDW